MMSVSVSSAKCYDVRHPEFRSAWARAFICEWRGGGSIAIQSDYGDFSYVWTSIGDIPLRKFLCSLDYHYFMKKARKDTGGWKFCPDKTVEYMRKEVLLARKDYSLAKGDARNLWEEIASLNDYIGEEAFYTAHYHNETLYNFFEADLPHGEIRDPACKMFWDQLWPLLTDCWISELTTPTMKGIEDE